MADVAQGYRKKQAILVLLVFGCLGVAVWSGRPVVAVGAVLAACGLCFWAASLEPQKKQDHHH
jgi:uncharacterized membrane protein